MIVGAAKSGTTSLLRYLGAHPRVRVPARVEFTGFDPQLSPAHRARELTDFLEQSTGHLTLVKNAGAYNRPAEIDLILEHNPACRLILILRDPVQRAHSLFRMASLQGQTQSTFSELIDQALTLEAEGNTADRRVDRYLTGGRYADRCRDLFARCEREQIAILLLDAFQRDPTGHYRGLCEWLGLETGFLPDFSARARVGGDVRSALLARGLQRVRSEKNPAKRTAKRILPNGLYGRVSRLVRRANKRSGEAGTIDRLTESRLREYFAEPNEELAEMLGTELEWSSSPAGDTLGSGDGRSPSRKLP